MVANHLVYILQCGDGTLYTGYTTDLDHRLKMHASGKGAKYTRGRGPFIVVFTERFATKTEAMQREYEIKRLTRKQKWKLIRETESRVEG
ncbi:MAG TPA: GIY-YIG nuclease family protein [Bacillota bacterium]|nr:GIY-YIG nuclease family protein [Bacillota bacterium]